MRAKTVASLLSLVSEPPEFCESGWEGLCLDAIDGNVFGIIFEVILLLYAFCGLAIVCDEYLVPSLETLCVRWNVREDVAGASFMAFGSAAPEVIINAITTIQGAERADLGIGAIMGSGLIAFMVVPSLCILLSTKRPLLLKRRPLFRDICFYTGAVTLLCLFFADGNVYLWEAGLMVLLYVSFILSVIIAPKIRLHFKLKRMAHDPEAVERYLLDRSMSFVERERLSREDSARDELSRSFSVGSKESNSNRSASDSLSSDISGTSKSHRVGSPSVVTIFEEEHEMDQDDLENQQQSSKLHQSNLEQIVEHDGEGEGDDDNIPNPLIHASLSEQKSNQDQNSNEEQDEDQEKQFDSIAGVPSSVSEITNTSSNTSDISYIKDLETPSLSEMQVTSSDSSLPSDGDYSDQPLNTFYNRKSSTTNASTASTLTSSLSMQPSQKQRRNHYSIQMSSATEDLVLSSKTKKPSEINSVAAGRPSLSQMPAQGVLQDGEYIPTKEEDPNHIAHEDFEEDELEGPIALLHARDTTGTIKSFFASPRPSMNRPDSSDSLDTFLLSMEAQDAGLAQSPVMLQKKKSNPTPRTRGFFDLPEDDGQSIDFGTNIITDAASLNADDNDDDDENIHAVESNEDSAGTDPEEGSESVFEKIFNIVTFPLHLLFRFTTIKTNYDGPNAKWYAVGFITSFIWVAVFSIIVAAVIGRWGELTNISRDFFGMTLVALGAEIPDIVQSVVVARRGYGSLAIAGCLGSQVTNVLVGLGFPWFLSVLFTGKSIQIANQAKLFRAAMITMSNVLLFFVLMVVLTVITKRNKVELLAWKGKLYLVSYAVSIAVLAFITFCGWSWCSSQL